MNIRPITLFICIFLWAAYADPADARQRVHKDHVESNLTALADADLAWLDTATGEVPTLKDARGLIAATLLKNLPKGVPAPSLDDPNFYCVIHVMKWTTTDNADPKTQAQGDKKSQPSGPGHWYIYRGGKWSHADYATKKRFFGARKLWVLFVHLDKPKTDYKARYNVTVTEKRSAVVSNLLELATLFFGGDRAPGVTGGVNPMPHAWAAGVVDIPHVPSDITVEPLRVESSSPTHTFETLGDAEKFDNEGNYRYDFSVGVPIKATQEVRFDGTTATPMKVDKQNIFALFNVFPVPVDIKNGGLRRVPHLVVGAAISEKPQHKLLFAAGWGPAFANFYAGAFVVKQPGNQTTESKWETQFAFGLNLTVRGTKKALEASRQ